MINIFVLVTILGHLPVILSAKSKGSENMEQILIVEDDSFLNKMLDYNLTADGYGVTSALNARTAAEAIRQREFDLVLLDINLPDGNGFELCKLIKPQHPDTIVIFLTANDQESDQIRGYEVRVRSPFQPTGESCVSTSKIIMCRVFSANRWRSM